MSATPIDEGFVWPAGTAHGDKRLGCAIPKTHVRQLLRRVAQVRERSGGIPKPFLELKTQNPHDVPGAFHPAEFFVAFTAVRPRPGYVLDYVYTANHHEASPLLYARPEGEAPLETTASFEQRFGVRVTGFAPDFPEAWLPALEFDAGTLGAFEAAVFLHEVRQFYLHWHAFYEQRDIVCESDRLLELQVYPSSREVADEVLAVLIPAVSPVGLRSWSVGFLTWNATEGLARRTTTLEAPRTLVSVESSRLVQPRSVRMY